MNISIAEEFLKFKKLFLIDTANNKKLISQASLASMTLPDQNTTQLQKGFVIACVLEAA